MIKHIVLFKLSPEGLKKQNLIVSTLDNLKNEIDFIRGSEIGINFSDEERAFDIALTVVFDSKEALNEYAIHPKHMEFVNLVKSLDTQTKVVDYEIQ